MPRFTKRLDTQYGVLNFYFNRIIIDEETYFHISVMERNSKAVMFLMENRDDRWRIRNEPEPPGWVSLIENELSNSIIHHVEEV